MLAMRNNNNNGLSANNNSSSNNKFDDTHPSMANGVCPTDQLIPWPGANHYLHLHFLLQGSGAGLNSSVALEEYVDILSVQQLLLDTPTTTSSLAGHSSSSGTHGLSKPRPRLNVQKAVEYSTVVGSHSSAGGKSRSPISIHTSHRNLSRRIASYVTLSWKCCIAPH